MTKQENKSQIVDLFKQNEYKAAYQSLEELILAYSKQEPNKNDGLEIIQALLFIINSPDGLDEEFFEYFNMLPEPEQKNLTQDQRFYQGAQNLMAALNKRGNNCDSIELIAGKFHQKNPYQQD